MFAVILTACSPSAEESYLQGREYSEAHQPVEAMEAFIAATRVHSDAYAFKARSFSNMATMCRIGERHELAYALYERSLEQFVYARDTLAQAYALNNMAWEQAVLANKPRALQLIDSALALCSDTAVEHKVLESHAASCLYAGEHDSVLYYAQKSPMKSAYFDILCAQAYTFLDSKDSALHYARKVVTQTNNPRYLDDVYYILAYCDSSAQADEIRTLAATRTDLQRNLERNDPAWIEAMRIAQTALETPQEPYYPNNIVLLIAIVLASVLAIPFIGYLFFRKRLANSLEYQCRVLRQSANLREELHWKNYAEFSAVCNERLSNIVAKLEQRGLTEREIRICVLVLIGLSYAQMADVLIRAESGIGKDKYMVAKRLGVSVRDLQKTLQDIANETYA